MKIIRTTTILILVSLWVLAATGRAQGILGNLFNQGQTQTNYLLQQIAALQVSETYLRKGYSTVKNGTGAISNIKNTDLSMHQGHFDSLKIVSPAVRNYSKVKGTILLQQQIIRSHNNTYPQLTAGRQLTATELDEYNKIYQTILQRSADDLGELQLVITDGKVQMTDDQRIAFIDKLYAVMQQYYAEERNMDNEALALAAQRTRQAKDNAAMKTLYGVQ